MSSVKTRVYAFLGGQHENIGDIVLRRAMVQELAPMAKLHVYVGGAPADYVRGLDLPPDAVLYRNFVKWTTAATAATLRCDGTGIVLNAGEVSCSRHDGMWHLALLPAVALGRLLRGPSFRVGVGARDRSGLWQWPIWLAGRLCKTVVWRDARSRDMYGYGTVGPDWAFRDVWAGPADGPRPYVALSFRGDRPRPSGMDTGTIAQWCRQQGWEPIVVSQVRRDTEANAIMANAIGCAHVAFPLQASAQEVELAVREVYARSVAILSDRLHALILAGSCGAAPCGIVSYEDNKLDRTLSAAGMQSAVFTLGAKPGHDLKSWLSSRLCRRHEVLREMESAALRVAEVGRILRRELGAGEMTGS